MAEWKRLSDNYKKAVRRRVSKSGDAGNKKLPTSEFFEQLRFIDDTVPQVETHSNFLSPPPSPSPSSVFSVDNDSAVTHANKTGVENWSSSSIPRRKKRCSSSELAIDALLAKALTDDCSRDKNEKHLVSCEDTDTDSLFCKSLVSSFKELTPSKKKRARVKILQVFCDLED